MTDTDEAPWYKQFWPWFIMMPPAAAVLVGVVMVTLAGGPPAMVVDDYGQIAMATEQRLERDKRAAELGISAQVELLPLGADQFRVSLILTQQNDTAMLPQALRLRFTHPTLKEYDQRTELTGSRGRYSGLLQRKSTRYYVAVTDDAETWRVTGELQAGASLVSLSSSQP